MTRSSICPHSKNILHLFSGDYNLEKVFRGRWTLATYFKQLLPKQGRHFGRSTVTMTTKTRKQL